MTAYYQLLLLGGMSSERYSRIKARFFEMLQERGLSASLIEVLNENRIIESLDEGGDPSKPTFAFYIGKVDHSDKERYS